MFFRYRRGCPFGCGGLFGWLILLFGLKRVSARRLSDEERAEYREKAKRFRGKLRDAMAVWDDEDSKDGDSSAE
jgi:hypothetical protein